MYEAITRGIRIRVTPQYLEDQDSSPDEGRYLWAYTIDISNEGEEMGAAALAHWRITDATRQTEEVRGPASSARRRSSRPATRLATRPAARCGRLRASWSAATR